jgi:hypothetical protein
MEQEKRFDTLTKWLVASGTRRSTFRVLAAGAVATGLGGAGVRESAAKNKNKKKKSLSARCKKTDECKGSLLCKPSNSQNSCYDTTQKRCCKKEGAECNDGCECCGVDVICNGGYCQSA